MSSTDHSTTAAILDKAADRIERTDLHKAAYFPGWKDTPDAISEPADVGTHLILNHDLPCCTSAAISYGATVLGETPARAIDAVTQHLRLTTSLYIPQWNDQAERTADDVTTTLRQVAEVLRAEAA